MCERGRREGEGERVKGREGERERETDQHIHVCTQVGGKPVSIFMSARGL